MNTIEFKKRTLKADPKRNAESRIFYDVIVDGKSLFEQFIDAESDMVGNLGFYNNVDLNLKTIDEYQLKGKSELESGQNMLFVCRECGDIGCGAITVKVDQTENGITWSNYKWENGYEESYESDFIDFKTLEFEKNEYFKALEIVRKNCLQQRI